MKLSAMPALADFFEVIAEDVRITPMHISLYLALAYKGTILKADGPFRVMRKEIMGLAKISARHTYNKGMHQLHDYGYIIYVPSLCSRTGSLVEFKILQWHGR